VLLSGCTKIDVPQNRGISLSLVSLDRQTGSNSLSSAASEKNEIFK
jgi:hypothetical protein